MSNDTLLGQKLPGPGERDAIHIAVIPVQALEKLEPGEHVGLNIQGKATTWTIGFNVKVIEENIGIVDPFLKHPVYPGEWFYLCLYQRSVTGMKHSWQHPAFPEPQKGLLNPENDSAKAKSEQWLRQFAANAEGIGMSYATLMEAAENYLSTGEDYCFGDDIDYSTNWEEFWGHYYNVTGNRPKGDPKNNPFFRCAC